MHRSLIGPAVPVLLLALGLLPAAPTAADIIHVAASSPGPSHDGKTWPSAYTAVQDALSHAAPGDEVWVAAGTYRENLTLQPSVGVYGGFAGGEETRSARDPLMNVTTLDGGGFSGITQATVTVPASTTTGTVLDGFTITNGGGRAFQVMVLPYPPFGTNYEYRFAGGGVCILGGRAVISNNLIAGNRTDHGFSQTIGLDYHLYKGGSGAGILVSGTAAGTAPTIMGNVISSNSAGTGGGGICVLAGSPIISGNTITSNTCKLRGGGVMAGDNGDDLQRGDQGTTVVLSDNVISGNSAGSGGGLFVNGAVSVLRNSVSNNHAVGGSSPGSGETYGDGGGSACGDVSALKDCLFAGNTAVRDGGGLWLSRSTPVYNNTIVHNAATGAGGGIAARGLLFGISGLPVLWNNVVAYNSSGVDGDPARPPALSHNLTWQNGGKDFTGIGDPGTADGNLSADPQFVGDAAGDYHIAVSSPCVNAGNDAAYALRDTDLGGTARVLGPHIDIGAYEAVVINPTPLALAIRALRVFAGTEVATVVDIVNEDADGDGRIILRDALLLFRRATGLIP